MSKRDNKAIYNAYMKEYMLARHKEKDKKFKELLGNKCVKCESTNDLQFDHIDPNTKSFTIKKLWSLAEEKVLAELAKCQLLCQPCHNLKTLAQNNMKVAKGQHGTVSSYRYCKCDLCKKAVSDYSKIYRKTHPRKRKLKKSLDKV